MAFRESSPGSSSSGCYGHKSDVSLNCYGPNTQRKRRGVNNGDPFDSLTAEIKTLALKNNAYANLADEFKAKTSQMRFTF